MGEDHKENKTDERKGISRRRFIQFVGVGALATSLPEVGSASASKLAKTAEKGQLVHVNFQVNGRPAG